MEEYAGVLCSKHLAPHVDSPHYKALVKALLKQALRPLSAADVKELETAVAGEKEGGKEEGQKGWKRRGAGCMCCAR